MAMKYPPLESRFWWRVRKTAGCWEWLPPFDSDGYGKIEAGGRTLRVHRVSWELHYGPIPDGMCVCHRCDNPKCVRPDHLFLGTNLENIRDRDSKGRTGRTGGRRGESHYSAKLTAPEVHQLFDLARAGWEQRDIAKAYGVHHSTVANTLAGRQWRSLGITPLRKRKTGRPAEAQ